MTSPSAAQASSLYPTPGASPLTILHTGGLPQEMLAALTAALAEGDRVLAFSPAEAEAALSGGHRLALLWTPAEMVLTGAFAQGLLPGRALMAWAQEAGALLDLFRRNRRRIIMVPDDLLAGAAGRAQLAERLDLPQVPAQPEVPAAPRLPRILALLAAPCYAEWRDVQEELRASSVGMREHALTGADLADLAAELADWRAQSTKVSLLQDRLANRQRLLDAALAEGEALRRAVGELLAEQNTARALAEARAAAETRLEVEADLAEARAALEGSGAALAAAQAEIEGLRRELEDRRAHEAAIYRSHSWRVTAPLRKVSLFLGRHRG